jgi:DNA-binding MarR family transcriptional regulator
MELTTTRVGGVYRMMKELAEGTSPDLSLRQVLVLLYVGSKGFPVAQGEIAERLDLGKATASKIVSALGGTAGGIKRADGLGLLTIDLDPNDYRTRLISLSKDGERVLRRVLGQLKEE